MREVQPGLRVEQGCKATGARVHRSPRRARHKPSNHCAGKAGMSRLLLYAAVHPVFCANRARGPRVPAGSRSSLRPLSIEGEAERTTQSSGETSRESAKLCLPTTPTPSSPGSTGRSSIPETLMNHPRRCGVLDSPLEPVIGLAKGETRWRGMTVRVGETELPAKPSLRGARDKIAQQFCAEATKQSRIPPRKDSGLLRCARNDDEDTWVHRITALVR